MAILTGAPRGTQDVVPAESYRWQFVERTALQTAELFGFKEIRVPTFEHTELFQRSVGDTTDVVQKEMYTFLDKGGRSVTLRPEGTAGVLRASIQNGLLGGTLPLGMSYLTSCFRYEKPQAGRFREFHQFGVELLGAQTATADAQVISLAHTILKNLGITGVVLEINSIGCPNCRPGFHTALGGYFEQHRDQLCETCLDRLEKNPMRIVDCKNPQCAALAKDAPKGLDYLCEECGDHFAELQQLLRKLNIAFTVNPTIVRGLDYYTKTVFEFIAVGIGAQATVCGGGRLDGLVELMGGAKTPAIGFAMGIERLLLVMEQCGCEVPSPKGCDIYIGSAGQLPGQRAVQLAAILRAEGFRAECDMVGRSVKAQMKYADKLGARLSCIIGDTELQAGVVTVKDMQSGEVNEVDLTDKAFVGFMLEAEVKDLRI